MSDLWQALLPHLAGLKNLRELSLVYRSSPDAAPPENLLTQDYSHSHAEIVEIRALQRNIGVSGVSLVATLHN